MWVYILFVVFILFALYKERQALGCPDIPDGRDCDNSNGKAVAGTKAYEDMSTEQILGKIEYASHYQDRWVKWRTSFIVAVLATFMIIYLMYQRVPTEKELAIYTIVLVMAITLTSGFYRFHLSDHVTRNIDEAVNILRNREIHKSN